MTKVFVSETVNRAADKAPQVMGELGMLDDTPVSLILPRLRPFRIFDGDSEVHHAPQAREILKSSI